MATFTSTQSGNWNDGATWGKTSPGVKGTDWPGTTSDVVNLGTTANQSHVVTYNVSETNELGQITIGATSGSGASRLEFSRSMSTKLTMGQVDILVQLTGELRVGASGAVIPKQYLAELIWDTSGDNTKGINLAGGGKLTVYGDPDYYGSQDNSTLFANWSAPASGNSSLTIAGDFSAKWAIGQELYIHKCSSAGYGTGGNTNDLCLVTIQGAVTYDGTKSTVPVTMVNIPGGAATFNLGGFVVNASRNVKFSKLGASTTIGQVNSTRPRMTDANVYGNTNINVYDTLITGFYTWGGANGCNMQNIVVRNGDHTNGNFANIAGNLISCSYGLQLSLYTTFNGKVFGITGYAFSSTYWNSISGSSYANFVNIYVVNDCDFNSDCYVFGNGCGFRAGVNTRFYGVIGVTPGGVACKNVTDQELSTTVPTKMNYLNVNVPGAGFILTRNSSNNQRGRIGWEHYNRVANAHYVYDAYGDIVKIPSDGTSDNPSQRSGGGANIIAIIPQSYCAAANYCEILNVRLWAAAGVSKTYRFYIQTTYVSLLTANFKLYGNYLDAGNGGHLATVSSTQNLTTRANASDWSQYVEVTINPAQDGFVTLYLRLMGYESGKKVWVDPMAAITGGTAVTVTPRWSYGEVLLDIDPVGGGLLINSSLSGGFH